MSAGRHPVLELPLYVAGERVTGKPPLAVHYPYTNEVTGYVATADLADAQRAIDAMLSSPAAPSRYQRSQVLERAAALLTKRADEFAALIIRDSGLCLRDARHEVGRAQDVLRVAAMEALRDDGQVFSCDVSPQEKRRKIFTTRTPLRTVLAITPFNHPLNQVAHKLAPAIAAGAPVILKPSDKTPLTAVRFAELLYEAGLPGWMLSVLLGPVESLVEPMVRDPRIELVSFTGSAAVGKRIASIAGYKRLCLELGGNSPLIVLARA